jgi:hypothetical protein
MLSPHLAELYGVETRVLVQAVMRNIDRFPDDFMFQLTDREFKNLKSQIVTSSWGGSRRAKPYAFTEHGAVMLASVLNSPIAVQSSIFIVRAFIKLREIMVTHKDIAEKIGELERKTTRHDAEIRQIIEAIKKLVAPIPEKPKERIGFYKGSKI